MLPNERGFDLSNTEATGDILLQRSKTRSYILSDSIKQRSKLLYLFISKMLLIKDSALENIRKFYAYPHIQQF